MVYHVRKVGFGGKSKIKTVVVREDLIYSFYHSKI